ncbi:hypothetical protein AFLA_005962 [Aspergillus flavus NRRL3357]|nr:hypothetical protein AFLA_005962 [Aspergillus flavus NRRL3357]
MLNHASTTGRFRHDFELNQNPDRYLCKDSPMAWILPAERSHNGLFFYPFFLRSNPAPPSTLHNETLHDIYRIAISLRKAPRQKRKTVDQHETQWTTLHSNQSKQ